MLWWSQGNRGNVVARRYLSVSAPVDVRRSHHVCCSLSDRHEAAGMQGGCDPTHASHENLHYTKGSTTRLRGSLLDLQAVWTWRMSHANRREKTDISTCCARVTWTFPQEGLCVHIVMRACYSWRMSWWVSSSELELELKDALLIVVTVRMLNY